MLLGVFRLAHVRAMMPGRFPLLLFGLQLWQYSCLKLAKRECWDNELSYLMCCATGATTDLEGNPCYPEEFAVDPTGLDVRHDCCGDDPQVLVYSPPKTATSYLLEMLRGSGLLTHKDHYHETAAYSLKRMSSPCYVITAARNLYIRNPSHYFYAAVLPKHTLPYVRLRHGQKLLSAQMYSGRWKTQGQFLAAAAPAIRADFRDANLATSRVFMHDWFRWFHAITGADIWDAFIRRPFAKYHVINASKGHCQCNVLVLCYEHIRYWPLAMRRFLPQVELKPQTVNNAASFPWNPMYRRFVSTVRYSANETLLMCSSDTMKLPFYSGRCIKHRGRWYIAPGVRGSPLPPVPPWQRTHPRALARSATAAAAAVGLQNSFQHANETQPVVGGAGGGGPGGSGGSRGGKCSHCSAVRVSSSTAVWNGGPASGREADVPVWNNAVMIEH